MTTTTVFHYTYGHKLAAIAAAGELRPTGTTQPRHERRTLWYSTDTVFEPTALKPLVRPGTTVPVRASAAELHELIGLYRFAGDAAVLRLRPWRAVPALANIHRSDFETMVSVGVSLGANPECWWATVHPQTLSLHRFEKWDGARWVAADLDDEVAIRSEHATAVRSEAGPRWTDLPGQLETAARR